MFDGFHRSRILIMCEIIRSKFKHNPDLAKKLLATGNAELIEGNTWNDTYWGVCNGAGQNKLGEVLMATRSNLRMPKWTKT